MYEVRTLPNSGRITLNQIKAEFKQVITSGHTWALLRVFRLLAISRLQIFTVRKRMAAVVLP